MFTKITIRKNQYYDSVFLMGFNNRLSKVPGVVQTAVFMGSDTNKEVLAGLGFISSDFQGASANDLIVGISSETQSAIDEIVANLDKWLTEVTFSKSKSEIRTLNQALSNRSDSNLVVISVPGEFAAGETRKSLEAGKHVFLFSDNVSIEDEIDLKTYASQHGLLVMGPDCGTSLIGGVGIGFANAVRRGKIGAIAAAGTGLQEFTSMVHNFGYGISHGIGTGGRDLSDRVGGITTLMALNALEKDHSTDVIAVISKPPGQNTLKIVVDQISRCKKPVICCFLGINSPIDGEGIIFKRAGNIDESVRLAIKTIGGHLVPEEPVHSVRLKQSLKGKFLRGVFAGGTFCYQSQQILREAGIPVYSNAPVEKTFGLASPTQSFKHTIIDMGDEFFMVGRPHPMIDGSQRALRILQETRDPSVGILLLDFILGFNSSMDPVGELIDSIQESQKIARSRGDELEVVASICGTDNDLQDIQMQTKLLIECGVTVFPSNVLATKHCVDLLRGSYD
jgi:FdrA protein